MSQIGAVLKALPIIGRLLERLFDWLEARKVQKRQEERKDAHEQIDADLDGALRDVNWVQSDPTRRDDGAPRDYDVSGPSKTLNRE